MTEVPDASWRICFREIAPRLLLFARQWVPSQADAEDVVQTAFVRCWKRQPITSADDYPLLFAAVRSVALDLLRQENRRTAREAHPDVQVPRLDAPFFDPRLEQREEAELVEAALNRLPGEQREVIVLRIWGDLTFAQIATTLDESINTVAARYRYGLEALRKHLRATAYERV